MRILKYVLLFFFSIIWLGGCSRTVLDVLYKYEIINDDYGNGDLFRILNLPQFKDPRVICEPFSHPKERPHATKPTYLFILGDSFTEPRRIDPDDFPVDSLYFNHWSRTLHFHPDTTSYNVLIVEMVERSFRHNFGSTFNRIVAGEKTFTENPADNLKPMQHLDEVFSSEAIEGRLDVILFYNRFAQFFKEAKASFNQKIFNRVNEAGVLSSDGQQAFYYLDIDTSFIQSSYRPLPSSEVDTIVKNLNESEVYLKKLGFDKVIYSVIPNKATALQTERKDYNGLIPRVVRHPDLKVTFLDVFDDFRKMGTSAYLKGDSHWTCKGQYLWLRKANQLIKAEPPKTSVFL